MEQIRRTCQRYFGILAISRTTNALPSHRTPTSTEISPCHRTLMWGRSTEGVLRVICQTEFLYPPITRAVYISTLLETGGYLMSGRRKVPSFSRVWTLPCLFCSELLLTDVFQTFAETSRAKPPLKVLSDPGRPLSYIARNILREVIQKKLRLPMIGEVPSVPQRITHVPTYALALIVIAHSTPAGSGEFLMKLSVQGPFVFLILFDLYGILLQCNECCVSLGLTLG